MEYSKILKEFREEEKLDELEPEVEAAPEVEVDTSDIDLGSMVRVIDGESFIADDLELSEEDFAEFQTKVESGSYAIVFDIDDDNPEVVDIVFEDGLEVFKIPKLNLEIIEDED